MGFLRENCFRPEARAEARRVRWNRASAIDCAMRRLMSGRRGLLRFFCGAGGPAQAAGLPHMAGFCGAMVSETVGLAVRTGFSRVNGFVAAASSQAIPCTCSSRLRTFGGRH